MCMMMVDGDVAAHAKKLTAPARECQPGVGAISFQPMTYPDGTQIPPAPEADRVRDLSRGIVVAGGVAAKRRPPQLLLEAGEWARGRSGWARLPLLLWFGYILRNHLRDPDYESIFGGLNLAIHEAGHIVFDDLTDVIKAQKVEAWQEVARRITHEIKNPLTPIKLSTERLIKKWQNKDEDFGAVFEKATKTIITEVEGLRRLVDIFSKYGKMPEINKSPADLPDLRSLPAGARRRGRLQAPPRPATLPGPQPRSGRDLAGAGPGRRTPATVRPLPAQRPRQAR